MSRKSIVIFAIVGVLLNTLACIPDRQIISTEAELSVQPSSQIEVGQTATISVVSQNLPKNLSYQWRTDGAGICTPQTSDIGETKYQAPDSIGELPERKVKVTVEFYFNGKKFHPSTELTIIPRSNITATPLGSGSPQPIAGTSPAPLSAMNPKIEINKSGVYDPDPQGEKWGPGEIEGRVSGVNPSEYQVILYSQTNQWWIQPYAMGDGRFTPIQNNAFSNRYHVGGRYAALLCKKSYDDPPPQTPTLPLNNPNVVAWVIVDGVRTIN